MISREHGARAVELSHRARRATNHRWSGENPKPIIDKLNGELVRIIQDREVQARFAELGLLPVGNSAAELAKILKEAYDSWGRVVKPLNSRLAR